MTFDDWRIVRKPFNDGKKLLQRGEPICILNLPNARSLENAGFLRGPNSEEETKKIYFELEKQKSTQSKEEVAIKKATSKPSKNGGD